MTVSVDIIWYFCKYVVVKFGIAYIMNNINHTVRLYILFVHSILYKCSRGISNCFVFIHRQAYCLVVAYPSVQCTAA